MIILTIQCCQIYNIKHFPPDKILFKIIIYVSHKNFRDGGARGVMVIIVGNGHGDASSNPGRDCISHRTNTLQKGMNPIILPPAMGKIVGQTVFFSLGEATSLGERKL